ncbi:MAG: hypothetical protein Q4E64_03380, partial [Phascolarctobacterium sp.]|uniref:hypothetical protein n=1 Tax=Phascolarctobacterium sp. TaxID=2049039 RepID=UPI0026DAB31B
IEISFLSFKNVLDKGYSLQIEEEKTTKIIVKNIKKSVDNIKNICYNVLNIKNDVKTNQKAR